MDRLRPRRIRRSRTARSHVQPRTGANRRRVPQRSSVPGRTEQRLDVRSDGSDRDPRIAQDRFCRLGGLAECLVVVGGSIETVDQSCDLEILVAFASFLEKMSIGRERGVNAIRECDQGIVARRCRR